MQVLDQRGRSITQEAFVDLKQALEDALAFERRERRGLNVTRIKAPRPKSDSSSNIVPNRQHLGALSMMNQPKDQPKYEVVACIAGRGFGVCREDMKKLLYATRGKVFTSKTMDRLIECTRLKDFRSQ